MARNQEIRLTSNILSTNKEAWQILRHSSEEKKEPVADQIAGLIKNLNDWSKSYNVKLKDVLTHLAEGNQDIVMGKLSLVPAGPVKKGQETESQGKSPSREAQQLVLAMEGASVFKSEKLVGNLTPKEARGYARLVNNINLNSMNINLPGYKQPLSLETFRSKSTIKLKSETTKLNFIIKIKESSRLGEQNSGLNILSTELVKQIETKKEEKVAAETKRIIKKAQKLKSDIFGLRAIIARQRPGDDQEIMDKWKKNYAKMDYKIQVSSDLIQSGKIKKAILKRSN